jgi:hypothetical protein
MKFLLFGLLIIGLSKVGLSQESKTIKSTYTQLYGADTLNTQRIKTYILGSSFNFTDIYRLNSDTNIVFLIKGDTCYGGELGKIGCKTKQLILSKKGEKVFSEKELKDYFKIK